MLHTFSILRSIFSRARTVRAVLPLLILSGIAFSVLNASNALAAEVNLALKKPYTFSPAPRYSYCTDPEDTIQLTDGESTQSYFWTQKGTVGWLNVPYAVITIDLGKEESIGRVEAVTAGGRAGVIFPRAVLIQVSSDGKTYRGVTDLIKDEVSVNGPFRNDEYAIRTLRSKALETKGRWVRVQFISAGAFTFCDEIRVFSGTKSPSEIEVSGEILPEPRQIYETLKTYLCVEERYQKDFTDVLAAVESSSVPDSVKASLKARAESAYGKCREAISGLPKNFRAILPLESNHAEFYRVQAALWKAEGCASLTAGPSGIWDCLERFQSPKSLPQASISAAAMQNETRFGAFTLFNAEQETRKVTLKAEGLSEAAEVKFYRVPWTDTFQCEPVACALPEAESNGDGTFSVEVLPGLVQQIWVEFRVKKNVLPAGSAKKTVRGKILCSGLEIPTDLTVYPLTFPEKYSLMIGGWDYTSRNGAYNVNLGNLESFLSYIQSRGTNAPWGNAGVLMSGCRRNDDGSVTIDTQEFDTWIERWPVSQSQEYFIFMAFGGWSSEATRDSFLGTKVGTPEFTQAVSSWMSAWKKHWAKKGIQPEQINLLLHDEPNESMKDTAPFRIWSETLHAAAPGVKVWEDPCYRKPAEGPEEFFTSCDVLCPNRPMWLNNLKEFDEFYLGEQKKGRILHLYSCSGPQRHLDPYSYCLLQAWEAARVGAKASFFWALGDGGGISSWNEYFHSGNTYCPLFIDPEESEVTGGKHFEAIRLSAQDYEYAQMLRQKIEGLKKTDSAKAAELEKKFAELLETVLLSAPKAEPGAAPMTEEERLKLRADLTWKTPRDRAAADRARVQILDWLAE